MPVTTNPELETDRVRRYTSPAMLEQIEKQIEENVRFYAAQPLHIIAERIEQLKQEWSIERYLQVNIATAGFLTALLALTSHRKWAVLTCTALSFFLYHGLRGFDPPIPLLRRMGVRTRKEIDRELFALKAVRGDFRDTPEPPRHEESHPPISEILQAVNR